MVGDVDAGTRSRWTNGSSSPAGRSRPIQTMAGRSVTRFRQPNVVAGGRVGSVLGRPRYEGGVFRLTGLPSARKSTLAMAVQRMLFDRGPHVYVLDGDTLGTSLNVDLGSSEEDRSENVRRTAAEAAVLADGGFVVICALISPFAHDRIKARASYPRPEDPDLTIETTKQTSESAGRLMEYIEEKTRP